MPSTYNFLRTNEADKNVGGLRSQIAENPALEARRERGRGFQSGGESGPSPDKAGVQSDGSSQKAARRWRTLRALLFRWRPRARLARNPRGIACIRRRAGPFSGVALCALTIAALSLSKPLARIHLRSRVILAFLSMYPLIALVLTLSATERKPKA